MKKIIFLLLSVSSTFLFSQMSNKGYKNLKLGMSIAQAKNIIDFKIKDGQAFVKYDNLNLELTFSDGKLWKIATESSKAKIIGYEDYFIGKSYKSIKAILGNKLQAANIDEGNTNYYIYHVDKNSRNNQITSCVLLFDDKKILTEIFTSHNP